MNRTKRILVTALALIMLLSVCAFADGSAIRGTMDVRSPSMRVVGSTVYCSAIVTYSGQYIDATLELYQGSTLVDSWNKTGTSYVSFNEPESFTSGLSYTLTISGTVGGVAFTPQSTTQTLW